MGRHGWPAPLAPSRVLTEPSRAGHRALGWSLMWGGVAWPRVPAVLAALPPGLVVEAAAGQRCPT